MSDAINDLRSRAGRILYRELPEEYRYRDTPNAGTNGNSKNDFGDLEALLHGFGHLLDQIRATTEQAHADSFAEPLEDGRAIQPWAVPYLADLLGAELSAPDPVARAGELNNSVAWFKSKGTLASIDDIGDVVLRSETVAKEGWRMTAQTPRMDLPPFTQEPQTATPSNIVTPDFRKLDRAVIDPGGSDPLFRLKANRHDPDAIDHYWRPLAPGGVPCFPRAYDDSTPRSPDLRDPQRTHRIGPHPRRTLIHVRPPQGVFHDALPVLSLSQAQFDTHMEGRQILRAEDLMAIEMLGDGITGPAITLKVPRELNLPNREITFEGIRFVSRQGPTTLKGGPKSQVTFLDCAAHTLQLATAAPVIENQVSFHAQNSIFEFIHAQTRHAQMEYCTIMEGVDFAHINASDCLFQSLTDTLICADKKSPKSCIRYSRFAPRDAGSKPSKRCLDARAGSNTTDLPHFITRWHGSGKDCVKRAAIYGEPGYGVLDSDTSHTLTAGAQDEGEMGVGHGLYHAASLRALAKKLEQFLPIGQEVAIFYDPMLALSPPILGLADSDN